MEYAGLSSHTGQGNSLIFAGLRKVTSILLLMTFLGSTAEMYQLMKVPLLVEHLRVHKVEDPSMTIWKFLCMHYDYAAKADADYDQDMKLPFKANDSFLHSSIADFIYQPIVPVFSKITLTGLVPPVVFDEQVICSSFLSNIWQPPKSC